MKYRQMERYREGASLDLEAPSHGQGIETWAWLLQRITSLFLLLFLGAHLWILHVALVGQSIDIASVANRLRSPFYIGLDVGLLIIVVSHGLNGLRAVLLDFGMFQQRQSAVTWILGLAGLSLVVFGSIILLPFISGGAGG
jgi:succinate dehydrogenase / fumarate reductase membrane anchor subunit